MKIHTATRDFLGDIRGLFPNDAVEVLPEQYNGMDTDLLIFTGGEDIHPKNYGVEFFGRGWFNERRDLREFSVFRDWRRGRLRAKKILGICRGLQLLNVALGGSLIYDIPTDYGKSHQGLHEISWKTPNIFSWLTMVNSLHHQGIRGIGQGMPYQILGIEPSTGIIEAIMWSDKILAFQFHPEFFPESQEKQKLSDTIREWVSGKEITDRIPKDEGNKYYSFFTSVNGLSINTSETIEELDEEDDEEIEEENEDEQF